VVVIADPPTPPKASDPQNLVQSSAEEAVRSAIRALRTNDANAFLRRLPEEEQRSLAQRWQQVGGPDGNPWIGGMINRVLRGAAAADGAQQVGQFITPFLAMIDPRELAERVGEINGAARGGDRRRGGGLARMVVQGGISAVVAGVLASGSETEQTRALHGYFSALAAWLPQSGLNDPAKAQQAAEALATALTKLGAGSIADLGKLELPQVLDRVAQAMPELKRVLAVYDLQLDQALDSVQLSATDLPGSSAKLVTVSFTAFGAQHHLPLKLVEANGGWRMAADSPITSWMRAAGGGDEVRGLFGGPGRGNQRGQRPARGDQPAPTAEPAPAPEADPGF
jgi:hypothetical protein